MATVEQLDQMRADIAQQIDNLQNQVSDLSSIHSDASAVDRLALANEVAVARGSGSGGRTALIVCVVFIVLLIIAIAIGAAMFTSRNAGISADAPEIKVDKMDVKADEVHVQQAPSAKRTALQQTRGPQVEGQRAGRKLNTLSTEESGPQLAKTGRPPARRLAQQPQAPKPVTPQTAGPSGGARRFKSAASLIDPNRTFAGPVMRKTRLAHHPPMAKMQRNKDGVGSNKMTQENLKRILQHGGRPEPRCVANVNPVFKNAGNAARIRGGNDKIMEKAIQVAKALRSGRLPPGPGGYPDLADVVANEVIEVC